MRIELPTFYYLDHFNEMISFVEETYAGLLDQTHYAFIKQYKSLSRDEQCLVVRMTNRRHNIFPCRSLEYDEIENVRDVIASLMKKKFIRSLSKTDYPDFLSLNKKEKLLELALKTGLQGVKKSWNKNTLLKFILGNVPYKDTLRHFNEHEYVVRNKVDAINFLLFLYFGKTHDDLKSFALRDLGVVRVNQAQSFTARFSDLKEAKASFYFSRLMDKLNDLEPDIRQLARLIQIYPAPESTYALTLRSKVAEKLGKALEKNGDMNGAIKMYQIAGTPDANERVVRLVYAQGQSDEAKTILERMIDDPANDDEFFFASDFYARKFGKVRKSIYTDLLQGSPILSIDEGHRDAPESGLQSYFKRNNWQVWQTENIFWHCLFGLIFWEELFESNKLSSGFDRIPHMLNEGTFHTIFEKEIDLKLGVIQRGQGFALILKTISNHWGKANGIFSWNNVNIEGTEQFFAHGNASAITTLLQAISADFRGTRDGFPDLMLARAGEVRFVEVKAEGDVLRRNQLARLKQLERAGFSAEVCRVKYQYDPEQTYVVVDTETTGGRNSHDRITEIGAVKIRNNEVIDEWHSLINPERFIPAFITGITGISNDMVRNAPTFGEVANDIVSFMDGAIFAAHNVNFDFGFMASEYRRLDQSFRYAKFCTCAQMRRHYPGHSSYSLANLCREYGIDLKEHHRALCDAKAAGQLLTLINHKRAAAG